MIDGRKFDLAWGQSYKTFSRNNLPQFHGNSVMLCIELHYLGKYRGMAVSYSAKKFYKIVPWQQTLIPR
jgi:hypothetical protein